MVELLAGADHDTARQHLAILNPAAALPTEAVYDIITDPGHPEDAILDALETGSGSGVILVRPAVGGALRPRTAGHLRLPAVTRYRCGLVPGDRLLLAVDPSTAELITRIRDGGHQ